MSKFCTSCGAQLDDNATFCTSCGAQLGAPAQPSAAPQQTVGAGFQGAAAAAGGAVKDTFNKAKDSVNVDAIKDSLSMENIKNLKNNPNKNTIVALGAIAIVVIILLIVVFNLIFANPYKGVIKDSFKAIEKGDTDIAMDTLPKCVLDYYDDENMTSKIEKSTDKELEAIMDVLEDEYGDNVKLSFEIKEAKKVKDSKLDDIKKGLKSAYKAKGIKVTKGYKVKLKVKIKGSDEKDDFTSNIEVYKIDGKWCMGDYADVLEGLDSDIRSKISKKMYDDDDDEDLAEQARKALDELEDLY